MVHFRIDAARVDSGDPDAIEETMSLDTANAFGRFDPRSTAKLGEAIEVAVSTANIHFFDSQTRLAV
jgi:multiple sugar transport system ATP-binding protein